MTKSGHFVLIRANTEVNITLCPRPPALEEVQAAVGGWVELVGGIRDFKWNGEFAQMYVNEEGLLRQLPVNRIATELLRQAYPGRSVIALVGDVVLLTGSARWS